ncbi:hypothetical protein A7K69_04155 [Parageobacillus thermoglucosidasius]|jgi:transposase InsO family protein|uniref:Integrase catalytic domain-containing protein n=1 Tax=Parageobacillus thermoglucosidasius TaxID=1426 RepID=A0A1B7KSZ9_PARTM|nr:DDE-type integrase/transposase/recombinase [Parageobacillus thermoglucosidasius]OAT73184.1 hypothetical protein A7K69_04155 [Parageobacillus thermoglucosidasius]
MDIITYLVLRCFDLYNNEIIAYQISDRQDVQLLLKTLETAVKKRQLKQALLYSDQGAVYTSYALQHLAKEKGITTSMPRKGKCRDNAVIESFHSLLKAETFYSQEKQNLKLSVVKQWFRITSIIIIKFEFRQHEMTYLLWSSGNRQQRCFLGWSVQLRFRGFSINVSLIYFSTSHSFSI